jgi:hypothetical protein
MYLAAQAKLRELQEQAFQMMTGVIKRLIRSLDDELNAAALDAEQRLNKAGLPIRSGDLSLLQEDAICKALWSCRIKAEKTLAEFHPNSAIGAVQFFCSEYFAMNPAPGGFPGAGLPLAYEQQSQPPRPLLWPPSREAD